MTGFADHFSGLASDYASFRPSYPREMIAAIAALAPARDVAWDCATGNGQAATLVAEHFARVVATDASAQQLERARPHERVEYRLARADSSGLATASVDLVTVAAAAHWLDFAAFYAEVARVLRPRGVLAAWTYDLVHVSPEVGRVMEWFYRERIGSYWPAGRAFVESMYTTLPFPYRDLALGPFAIRADLDRRQFSGYVGTWSSVARCREREGVDPIAELDARLAQVWPNAKERRGATWPLALRAGRAES